MYICVCVYVCIVLNHILKTSENVCMNRGRKKQLGLQCEQVVTAARRDSLWEETWSWSRLQEAVVCLVGARRSKTPSWHTVPRVQMLSQNLV